MKNPSNWCDAVIGFSETDSIMLKLVTEYSMTLKGLFMKTVRRLKSKGLDTFKITIFYSK